MFAGLTADQVGTPAVLLGVVFLLVMFGLLVPGRTHNRILRDKDGEIANLRALVKEQSEQITILSGSSETALHIGDEIRRLAGSVRRPLDLVIEEEGSP